MSSTLRLGARSKATDLGVLLGWFLSLEGLLGESFCTDPPPASLRAFVVSRHSLTLAPQPPRG
jgi:hypothetical protein